MSRGAGLAPRAAHRLAGTLLLDISRSSFHITRTSFHFISEDDIICPYVCCFGLGCMPKIAYSPLSFYLVPKIDCRAGLVSRLEQLIDLQAPRIPNPKLQTPNPKPRTPNPKSETPNPTPETPNAKPETPNPNQTKKCRCKRMEGGIRPCHSVLMRCSLRLINLGQNL